MAKAIDSELASAMDMPLYNEEAKYFLADFHKTHNLEFKDTPCFTVNLDLAPSERWAEVLEHHSDIMPRVQGYLEGMMHSIEQEAVGNSWIRSAVVGVYKMWTGGFKQIAVNVCQTNPAIDFDEVKAVAELAGLELEDFCMLQMAYEVAAHCSSMVVDMEDGDGTCPCHARTMDWGALFLRGLSCQLIFTRGGTTLYKASTWAGYMGCLTGVRAGAFSITVNYRNSSKGGTIKDNFDAGLAGAWPVGFLVRHCLERPEEYPDYPSFKAMLETAPLMAPTYFIVAGAAQGEGCCLTRERTSNMEDYEQTLDGSSACPSLPGPKPVTQTNVDCRSEHQHRDSRESAPRRVCAVYWFKEHKNRVRGTEEAWQLLQTHPVNNAITLYATVMVAKTGFIETKVPDDTQLLELLDRLAKCTHSSDPKVVQAGQELCGQLRSIFDAQGPDSQGALSRAATVEAFKRAFKELNGVSKSTIAVSNALKDAAYRWDELKLDGADQGAIRFPLFLQMLCAPMIGFQAPS